MKHFIFNAYDVEHKKSIGFKSFKIEGEPINEVAIKVKANGLKSAIKKVCQMPFGREYLDLTHVEEI